MEQINYRHYRAIEEDLYNRLNRLGLIPNEVRKDNVGKSDYSKHTIQPWSIWLDYNLNAWDADIVKRTLRTKEEPGMSFRDSRIMDYNKIIHISKERIRQLELEPEDTYISTTIKPRVSQEVTTLKTEELEPNITYQLKGSELATYSSFIEEHKKTCNGHIHVCFDTESGIGTTVKLYCPECGTELDITDVESW